VLADAYQRFPAGTIHVVVVDPGVGSARAAVGAEVAGHRFVAPDNGVLSQVLTGASPSRVVALTEAKFWQQPLSNTFHGRDLFASVAAHWSRGVDLAEFGQAHTAELRALQVPAVTQSREGFLGEVLWVDAFGNLVTNIEASHIAVSDFERCVVRLPGCVVTGIRRYYSEVRPEEVLALFGSSGRLEIAIRQGSAAKALQCDAGTSVLVTLSEPKSTGHQKP
jgi:S-adenosylmethionine hydrolase